MSEQLCIESKFLIIVEQIDVPVGCRIHGYYLGIQRHGSLGPHHAVIVHNHNQPLAIVHEYRVGHLLVGEPGRRRPVVLVGLFHVILAVIGSNKNIVATDANGRSDILYR